MSTMSKVFNQKGVVTNNSYRFGIDRTGGLFLSIFNEEGNALKNFTQFHPFEQRLTVKGLEDAIPTEDLQVIRQQEVKEMYVHFEVGADEDFKGETPKILLDHIQGEHEFECTSFGDILDAHSHFTKDVYCLYVTFTDSYTADYYEFGNDAADMPPIWNS